MLPILKFCLPKSGRAPLNIKLVIHLVSHRVINLHTLFHDDSGQLHQLSALDLHHLNLNPNCLQMPTKNSYNNIQGVAKKIVPHLCGCSGGAVDSIISVFTQLHKSDFNLELLTLYESIWNVVADLWQRKAKISGASKTALHCSLSKSSKFQRKGPGIALIFLLIVLWG